MGMGISLHGGSSSGDFERWLKRALEVDCLTLRGSSVKGTWREDSLAGDPKRYVKALEMGVCFNREHRGGALFLGSLREKKYSYLEEFLCAFQKICTNVLLTGISLHRGPVGEPGWSLLAVTYDRKEKVQ